MVTLVMVTMVLTLVMHRAAAAFPIMHHPTDCFLEGQGIDGNYTFGRLRKLNFAKKGFMLVEDSGGLKTISGGNMSSERARH